MSAIMGKENISVSSFIVLHSRLFSAVYVLIFKYSLTVLTGVLSDIL